jgi:hypothetical protein
MKGTNINQRNFGGDRLNLCVADLRTTFHVESTQGNFLFSPAHEIFINYSEAENCKDSAFLDTLDLELVQADPLPPAPGLTLLCQNKIWELWKDERENFIFYNPLQSPVRVLCINPEYTQGTISGNFWEGENTSQEIMPQSLEIILYSNWLANYGDLILHASGFILDGEAFAFLGESGVGKSTLIRSLVGQPGVQILGEDQVVLRYQDQQFWIYGTPWHINETLCSPHGAPLGKIYFLDRQAPAGIHSVNPADAYTRILQTAFIPYYRSDAVEKIMDTLLRLTGKVSMYTMSYQLGENVLELLQTDCSNYS